MPDKHDVAQMLKQPAADLRMRYGVIAAVNADGTVDVTLGGSVVVIGDVKVASSCCPIAGATCILMLSGNDLVVRDTLATAVAHCHVRRAAVQTISTASWTPVSFDTEDVDPYAMRAAGAPTRITIATPGIYNVFATAEWALSATGARLMSILLNGAGKAALKLNATGSGYMTTAQEIRIAQGEYLELSVYQDTGGDLNLTAARLRASWKSPL